MLFRFYGREIRAFEILRGDVDPPPECNCLYEVMEMHKKNAQKELVRMAKKEAMKQASGGLEVAKSKLSVCFHVALSHSTPSFNDFEDENFWTASSPFLTIQFISLSNTNHIMLIELN